ncbi:T3SS effector HopA1 family protein [Rhodococcus rhodnii]|uniref:T3SS effector HopA1 family protein n=1 Tax=Rhodococcus rhodnii TaxID=38312 RepID=UPI000932EAC9|nr:T3SS effector HopA1 family protein [Rhodococcus rhodnii]
MTTNSSAAVAEVLQGILERTGRRGDNIMVALAGDELTGPAGIVRHKLAAVLYEILHARRSVDATVRKRTQGQNPTLAPKPAGGSLMEVALLQAFADRRFVARRALVEERANSVVYMQNGVRMETTRDRVVGVRGAEVGITLQHHSSAVSPGFFYVYGPSSLDEGQYREKETRVYLSIGNPEAAGPLFVDLVRRLDAEDLDFDMKVLTCPTEYPRSDSIVLYVNCDPEEICDSVQAWSTAYQPHFVSGSLLTRERHPGISTAQEPRVNPDDPTLRNLSFGQHRSLMIADAVIEFALTGGVLAAALEKSAFDFGVHPHDYSANLPIGASC